MIKKMTMKSQLLYRKVQQIKFSAVKHKNFLAHVNCFTNKTTLTHLKCSQQHTNTCTKNKF